MLRFYLVENNPLVKNELELLQDENLVAAMMPNRETCR